MSASTKRPRMSSTTCWCSCAAGNARSSTPSGGSMAVAPSAPGAVPPDAEGAATPLPIQPSLKQARALGAEHNLIPLRHSFIDDCQTPVSAFLKLRALAPSEPAFLLESAEQGRVGRWSFIVFRPRTVVRWSLADGGDPYALAQNEVRRLRQAPV